MISSGMREVLRFLVQHKMVGTASPEKGTCHGLKVVQIIG